VTRVNGARLTYEGEAGSLVTRQVLELLCLTWNVAEAKPEVRCPSRLPTSCVSHACEGPRNVLHALTVAEMLRACRRAGLCSRSWRAWLQSRRRLWSSLRCKRLRWAVARWQWPLPRTLS